MKLRRRSLKGAAVILATLGLAVSVIPTLAGASGNNAVESQRSWMRRNGELPGIWVWRVNTEKFPDWPPGADPARPDTCVGCHSWIEGKTITQQGFTNVFGVTPRVVNQDVSPKKLLDGGIHVDAATGEKSYDSKHAERYDAEGCAFCHKRHGPAPGFGCGAETCHGFWNTPAWAQMHSTHAPLLPVEQPVGDPENFKAGNPACGYCHKTLNPPVGGAACWNCHMTAHAVLPVRYWKPTATEATPDPSPSAEEEKEAAPVIRPSVPVQSSEPHEPRSFGPAGPSSPPTESFTGDSTSTTTAVTMGARSISNLALQGGVSEGVSSNGFVLLGLTAGVLPGLSLWLVARRRTE